MMAHYGARQDPKKDSSQGHLIAHRARPAHIGEIERLVAVPVEFVGHVKLLVVQEFESPPLLRSKLGLACVWVAFDSCGPYIEEDMIEKIETRECLPNDVASIETLYRDAFPDEDLLPLVRELQREGPSVVSLVGTVDKTPVGHVVFTACKIVGRTDKVALLGPLAVAPAWQRQGVGSTIVRVGLQRLEIADTNQVYVLGDPAYYRRFGFEPDDRVAPPYPLPVEWRDAWQSLTLCGDSPPFQGVLSVPQPWRKQALWAP